jgi:signal peptidase I
MARLLGAADRFPIPTFVVVFLLFAGLLRYWRFYLPWGYCLAQLAPPVAATVSRAELDELERKAAKPKRAWLELVSLGAWLAVAAAAALGLRDQALQSYSVLSSSMLPSFEQGDELSTNRRAYAGASHGLPARGDVVIFHSDEMQEVVKRVIGLPGDEIRMRGGFPIVNGWEVPSCDVGRYVHLKDGVAVDGRVFVEFLAGASYLTLHVPPARPFDSYVVQPGEVFVLGDNRNSSLDSRNWRDGAPSGLPASALVGRVDRIVLSRKRSGAVDYASLFSRLGLQMNADGFDLSEAQSKLEACIKSAPASTQPPAAAAPASVPVVGAMP